MRACRDGVNVVIWAFAHLEADAASGALRVRPTFDVEAVRATQRRIERALRDDAAAAAARPRRVAHLVAFGGWNGPHPDAAAAGGRAWFRAWDEWNAGACGGAFDGVDWDLEGHDDPAAPTASLRAPTLALVADFSRAAKAAGYAVGLAPAESYLDGASPLYSEALNLPPLAPWDDGGGASRGADGGGGDERPPGGAAAFPYAGRNAYAPILAAAGVETFDFVSVQLYEGYSRACHALTRDGTAAGAYVAALAARLARGWRVELPGGATTLRVPPERLVVGLANGWADGAKFVRVDAAALRDVPRGALRGFMFWVIDEEGATPEGGTAPLYFARELSAALRGDDPPAPEL